MFGKLDANKLYQQFKHYKKQGKRAIATIGKHYQTTKDVLNRIDKGVNTAKAVYNDVKPTIQQLAGDQPINRINKGIQSYDQMRNRVVEGHNQAEKHVGNVVGALKKNGINLGI